MPNRVRKVRVWYPLIPRDFPQWSHWAWAQQRRRLLFHEALLEHGGGLLRFREGQAEVLHALAGLLQDHRIGEGFFVAIASSHTTSWSVIFMGAILQSG